MSGQGRSVNSRGGRHIGVVRSRADRGCWGSRAGGLAGSRQPCSIDLDPQTTRWAAVVSWQRWTVGSVSPSPWSALPRVSASRSSSANGSRRSTVRSPGSRSTPRSTTRVGSDASDRGDPPYRAERAGCRVTDGAGASASGTVHRDHRTVQRAQRVAAADRGRARRLSPDHLTVGARGRVGADRASRWRGSLRDRQPTRAAAAVASLASSWAARPAPDVPSSRSTARKWSCWRGSCCLGIGSTKSCTSCTPRPRAWPAGVRLAVEAHRLNSGSELVGVGFLDQATQDDLLAEILESAPMPVRRYVHVVSHFPSFSVELCDAAIADKVAGPGDDDGLGVHRLAAPAQPVHRATRQ